MEGIDMEGIRNLYDEDDAVRTLLNYITGKHGNVPITSIEELNSILHEKGIHREHPEQVKLLQKLADLGCGVYRNGRRTQPTRIMWNSQIQQIQPVLQEDTKEPLENRNLTYIKDTKGSVLTHTYPLRPDLSIELTLPENLTQVEASRLARHIETLPFAS